MLPGAAAAAAVLAAACVPLARRGGCLSSRVVHAEQIVSDLSVQQPPSHCRAAFFVRDASLSSCPVVRVRDAAPYCSIDLKLLGVLRRFHDGRSPDR